MSCSLCRQRPDRRQCPAVGRRICTVCCGTRRQVEISCPPDCGYLAAAEAHPPASVRRQRERDVGFIVAVQEGLSDRQAELFWAILALVAGFRSDPLMRVLDEDLAEAAGSLAATYETADRGVIYEHRPQSLVAQRLVTDIKAILGTMAAQSGAEAARHMERDAAAVLRRLEAGARNVRQKVDEGPTTALDIVARVVARAVERDPHRGDGPAAAPPRPVIITP